MEECQLSYCCNAVRLYHETDVCSECNKLTTFDFLVEEDQDEL